LLEESFQDLLGEVLRGDQLLGHLNASSAMGDSRLPRTPLTTAFLSGWSRRSRLRSRFGILFAARENMFFRLLILALNLGIANCPAHCKPANTASSPPDPTGNVPSS